MKTTRKKINIIFSFCLVAITIQVHAQSTEIKKITYEAYLNKNLDMWQKGVEMSLAVYSKNKQNATLLDLALAQYGLLNATMIEKQEDIFNDYVDNTVENIEKLIDQNKNWGEPKAILSSVYGVKMAYSPWKGIFLGSKSSNLMEAAMQQSKESALIWKLYGNSKLYTPESFGGDKLEAAKAYEKAITLFESQPESTKNNWIYLDALAHLGITYMKLDMLGKARELFEKALTVEPEFNWVKTSLLPQLDKS